MAQPVIPITINGFLIDASIREEHQKSSTVTDYPIEKGSNVTQNVIKNPDRVTVSGVVSNTPLAGVLAQRDATLPTDDFLAAMDELHESGESCTITTALRTYDDMMLEDLSIPVDSTTGRAIMFTARFKKVVFVQNTRAFVPVAVPSHKSQDNIGLKASTQADPPAGYYNVNNPDGADASLLGQAADAFGVKDKITKASTFGGD